MHDLIIAEDNPRDREFLRGCLSAHYNLIMTTNGDEALAECGNLSEPLLLTDLQMPKVNGLELAKSIWNKSSLTRIIFWSHHHDEMYLNRLSRIIPPETVYGYVLKNNESEVLLRAVNLVFEECQCWIDPTIRGVQSKGKCFDAISDIEYEALVDIALGLTDNTIAQRRYLSKRGVQNRLKSLYFKLGLDGDLDPDNKQKFLNSRSRAVFIALQRGLLNTHELTKENQVLEKWLKS